MIEISQIYKDKSDDYYLMIDGFVKFIEFSNMESNQKTFRCSNIISFEDNLKKNFINVTSEISYDDLIKKFPK